MTDTRATFGTISSGTMLPEDLIPAFSLHLSFIIFLGGSLKDLDRGTPEEKKLLTECHEMEDYDTETAGYVLAELFEALDSHAPQYGYFGAHPGDGANYGFWLSDDMPQTVKDDGGFVGDKLPDLPSDSGEALVINDHGNATLYGWDDRTKDWVEVWAIV
jgi:hypothetical protein